VSAVTLQEEERPLTDAELEILFPSVPWRDPIRISDFDGNFAFACRFCIARHGIRGGDIPSLSMSAREVRRHIREHHPWNDTEAAHKDYLIGISVTSGRRVASILAAERRQ